MKKSLVRKTKGRVGALRRVKTSLISVFDLFARLWKPARLSCFLVWLIGELLQGLCQAQDPGAVAMKI